MTGKRINDAKKEYLNEYKRITLKILSLEEQEATIRAEMESAKNQEISDMPRGEGGKSDLSDYMVRLERIQQKIAQKKAELRFKRLEIEEKIINIQDGQQSEVIRLRYLELLGWKEIRSKLDVSERQVYILHGEALQAIEI
ncbi:DUF1492 domain-containing protein [Anaerostipes caccae]|uniref:DUF1492 domain-containing protein n=1 Tax=Anaerostipes caccae TaxID=105841 RepID=UPI0001F01900|nr:DUF1492 domain-containing protein [Anaerostipes caccae]EFV21365.1 hypothetical protein HMPREF1011_02773 [Anaerostipes caccae]